MARCHNANLEFGLLPGSPLEYSPDESHNAAASMDSTCKNADDNLLTSSSSFTYSSDSDEESDSSTDSEFSDCSML